MEHSLCHADLQTTPPPPSLPKNTNKSAEPFIFSDFLPAGPAARVLLKHPSWGPKVAGVATPPSSPKDKSTRMSMRSSVQLLSQNSQKAIGEDFAQR